MGEPTQSGRAVACPYCLGSLRILQKEAGPGSRSEPVTRVGDCMWSSARLDRTSVIMNLQEYWTPALGEHRAADWGMALGTSPLTAELVHSGSVQTMVLNCVLISEPTKLQDIAPNPLSPRWAWGNTVGHKTKWTDVNVGDICGKQEVWTGRGRGQYCYDTYETVKEQF